MKHIIFSTITLFSVTFLFSCGTDKPNENEASNKTTIVDHSSPKKEDITTKSETEISEDEESVSPEQLAKAKSIIEGVSDEELSAVDVERVYKTTCTSCHGPKGNLMAMGSKDLTISKVSLEESVAQIYFGKGLMLPYNETLSEAEIVAVAKFVETLRK